jgi:two-component system response regulator
MTMDKMQAVDILLVEDNPQDAELTVRALKKKNLANRLVVVDDGAEALDFIFGRGKHAAQAGCAAPQVILLDLKLPKVGGRTRLIPVVIVTSSREDPDIKTAYALGANSYVVKPVDFDAFAEAVSSLGMYWLMVNQPARR